MTGVKGTSSKSQAEMCRAPLGAPKPLNAFGRQDTRVQLQPSVTKHPYSESLPLDRLARAWQYFVELGRPYDTTKNAGPVNRGPFFGHGRMPLSGRYFRRGCAYAPLLP